MGIMKDYFTRMMHEHYCYSCGSLYTCYNEGCDEKDDEGIKVIPEEDFLCDDCDDDEPNEDHWRGER